MYDFFVNGFRVPFLFLFIIKVSKAQAGPVVVLVYFIALPLCEAASVFKGTPNGKSGCRPHRCTCHLRGAQLFQFGRQFMKHISQHAPSTEERATG